MSYINSGFNVDGSGPKVLATVGIFALQPDERESISRMGWIYWCEMLYPGIAYSSRKLNSCFSVKHLYIERSASKFGALLF